MQGIQGIQGVQGSKGDKGDAGEPGSSGPAYYAAGFANNIQNATVTVASKTVPAGWYIIIAKAHLQNSLSAGDANARCVLRADGIMIDDTDSLDFPRTAEFANNSFGGIMILPLHAYFTSPNPMTILVECNESNGEGGALDAHVQLTAIKVGGVQ